MSEDLKTPQKNEEFLRRLTPYLERHWDDQRCHVCGGEQFTHDDKLWYMAELQNRTVNLGGPVMPLVAIICASCGTTNLINALVTGLIDQDSDSSETV